MKEATKLRWWIQVISKIRRTGFSHCRDIQPFYFTNPLRGFRAIQVAFTYAPGFRTRPTNRMAPVSMSRIKKMNGRVMVEIAAHLSGARNDNITTKSPRMAEIRKKAQFQRLLV